MAYYESCRCISEGNILAVVVFVYYGIALVIGGERFVIFWSYWQDCWK